jgi:hypothetical protein
MVQPPISDSSSILSLASSESSRDIETFQNLANQATYNLASLSRTFYPECFDQGLSAANYGFFFAF